MTTLIKNIVLVDGSGKPPFKADVLVRDAKIMAVGNFPAYKADRVITGNEAYLVPGFIDTDVTSDRYLTLFSQPAHSNFLKQGVTTTLIGQCGFSLAPNFYGSLHNFVNWASVNTVNVNWKSVAEFLEVLKTLKLGVNVGTFVGHKVVREDIVKDPQEAFRKLNANELGVFKMVLERALKDGAFGFSSGLGYAPYQDTPYNEIRTLVDVVKQHGGIYTTHLRNEKEDLLKSLQETFKVVQEVGIPTILSHLRPFIGFEEEYDNALSLLDERSAKAHVYFNMNPFSASAVPVNTFLPPDLKKEDVGVVIEKIKDPAFAKKVEQHLLDIDSKNIMILHAPGMEFLNGKTLYEFAQNRKLGHREALLNLMEITRLRAVVLHENLNIKSVKKAIVHERALVSTNSPSVDGMFDKTFIPERMTNSFPAYLTIADQAGVPLERAIAKLSGLPAKLLGLDGRGFVSDGYNADLVLLSKDFSVGTVLVNGEVVVEDGNIVKGRPSGQVLVKKV